MGSIGSFKFPEHDIDTAVEIIETAHNKGITKQEILADALGHSSPDSGAFRNKLTSLRRYGLITGRGDLELSRLSKQIVSPKPNSNEREIAIARAVRNVDILDKLYNKLEADRPQENFWYQIVEVTDAERAEAKEKSNQVKSLYVAGLPYVKQEFDATDQEDSPEEQTEEASEDMNESHLDETFEEADAILITPDARIEIRSKPTYAAAEALFEDLEKKY